MSEEPSPKRKRPLRHLIRTVRNWIGGLVGPPLLALWIRTLRRRLPSDWPTRRRAVTSLGRGVFVFWHQRLLGLAGLITDPELHVLISEHGDGELIARIISGVGMRTVRGSTTRGGVRAVIRMLRAAKAGATFALTPDGPRGPKEEFQEGALFLAAKTGLPIVPLTVSYRRFLRLPSWDGFQVPWPLTAMVVRHGEPLHIPADATPEMLETLRQEAERQLMELTQSTDRDFEALYAGK